jgi:hypothetical protein
MRPRKSPPVHPLERIWQTAGTFFSPEATKRFSAESRLILQRNVELVADYIGEACQPCRANGSTSSSHSKKDPVLGISRLESPRNETKSAVPGLPRSPSISSRDTPVDRRRQRHEQRSQTQPPGMSPKTRHEEIEVTPNHHVEVNLPPTDHRPRKRAPVEEFEVKSEDADDLERSISELTMRSSYAGGESLLKIPDNRRMAYYAVGKHHRQSGRGGNRRCYFSGKLILGGAPFYAGCVQQGLRTLVVFCLPSAINLPDAETLSPQRVGSSGGVISAVSTLRDGSRASRMSAGPPSLMESRASLMQNRAKRISGNASLASKSRLSSLDDLSLDVDGDLDPNWGLDNDFLLKVLPPASPALLTQMESTYPEQFETLPVQVRSASCWKLYVKFCFFSGLPIAEGEMHYKVRDDLADQVYGEEIVLSHEVMEAVNGESADILTLPNLKTFRYLRAHYGQQCSKLDDRVFLRTAWVRVAPEI